MRLSDEQLRGIDWTRREVAAERKDTARAVLALALPLLAERGELDVLWDVECEIERLSTF